MKQEIVDLVSQKTLLQEMNLTLKKRLEDLESSTDSLKQIITEKEKTIDDLRDDKKVLSGLLNEPRKNKVIRNVTIVAALGLSMFIFISYIPSDFQFYHTPDNTPIKTQYLIQNLKNNKVDTWKPWNLVENQALNINIVNAANVPKEKINAIKDAILSEESVKIDKSLLGTGPVGTTSTYYRGWQGAVKNMAHENTMFHIPTKFNIVESKTGGEITITLLDLENPDGYSGYTQTTVDGTENLKSSITIYNAKNVSVDRLKAIVRHEFGHALGLGHSSNQDDLMYYVLETNFPFISDCDINSVRDLYDGKALTDISCGSQKTA